jgi:hypothetical protein
MKLSNETLAILKNFASISAGLYVPGGSKVRVKEAQNKVLAEAEFAENFPSFCVADLSKFLSILTADKEVDVDFKGSDIVITMLGGRSKINYRCSPKNVVNVPKDTTYAVEDPFVEFTLTAKDLAYLKKTASLLSLPCIAVEHDGTKSFFRVFDPKNDSDNSQTLDLDSKGEGMNYQIIFNQENLNFVDGDYDVKINKACMQLTHKNQKVSYWVVAELGSHY